MKNEKKETAVDWLFNQMFDPTYPAGEQIKWLEQAKAMEREQIKDAHEQGQSDEKDYWDIGDKVGVRFMVKSEEYYKQTYGGNDQ